MQIAYFGLEKLPRSITKFFLLIFLGIVIAEAKEDNLYFRFDAGSIRQSNHINSTQHFYKISGNKKLKRDFVYVFGLGYRINKYLRTDLTFSKADNLNYISSKKTNITFNTYFQNFEIYSTLLNFYYDFPFQKIIKPYIGIGIGYSKISVNNGIHKGRVLLNGGEITSIMYNSNNNCFSYALLGGLTIKANEKFEFDFNYKYQNFGNSNGYSKLKDVREAVRNVIPKSFKIKANIITLGVRYNF